jgi:hypothetical protein
MAAAVTATVATELKKRSRMMFLLLALQPGLTARGRVSSEDFRKS